MAHKISKICRSPSIRDTLWHPLQSKGQIIPSHSSFRDSSSLGLFAYRGSQFNSGLHYIPYIELHEKLPALSGDKSSNMFYSIPSCSSRDSALWAIWSRKCNIVGIRGDKTCHLELWQALIGEPPCTPCGLCCKTLPLAVRSHISLEKIVPTVIKVKNLAVNF